MPKNPNISKVLVIGSGPIVIGQAAEFDYAGAQACRVLRQEGVTTVLVNSNPATIMTDKHLADAIYLEPLTAETVAGVCKLMTNLDLIYAANKIRIEATCNTTIGKRGHLSTRLQPNHSTDNVEGITASLFEGLSYGCGDALLGLNPVNDTVSSLAEVLKRFDEVKNRFEIPTQICVLGHITTQIEAVRRGAPCDMIFQSIAGSQKGNTAFGFSAATVEEAIALLKDKGTAKGPNVMYFETGQGSELSSDAHYGADQVTMEARCYAFADRKSVV